MKEGSKRVLLVAAKTGYQVREFASAAEELGVELVLATDRCHVLEDPWGDQAAPVDFTDPAGGIEELVNRGPFDGILAVGDAPAYVAAQAADALGLRYHPPAAAAASKDKSRALECFRVAGLPVPGFQTIALDADPDGVAAQVKFPCVLKPLSLSGSRGVIRAGDIPEFVQAFKRVKAIVAHASRPTGGEESLLVEDYIPGVELAVEGVVRAGHLIPLALFDKPDPLDGPFFEETIYVTPSRQPITDQDRIYDTVERAIQALGFTDGPVHAEVRLNAAGVWMLEAAARPIGGLCSRVLNFTLRGQSLGLEALLLRHAVGEDAGDVRLAQGGHGVLMIPIPRTGVYHGVDGLDTARAVSGITDIVITAKQGQMLESLPEGASYLGFMFAKGVTPGAAEAALRQAHDCLRFEMSDALPVVK